MKRNKWQYMSVLLLTTGSAAWAQDRCASIIPEGGAYQHSTTRGKEQVETWAYADLSRSNERDREHKGNYAEYIKGTWRESKKEAMKNEKSELLKRGTQSEILLSSGDPVIVNAWLECMRANESGLAMRLSANDGKNIQLHLTYIPERSNLARRTTTLTQDAVVPAGFVVTSGGHFLKAKSQIGLGNHVVDIVGANAVTPLTITVHTSDGSKSTYLPPRMKMVTERRLVTRTHTVTVSPKDNAPFEKAISTTEGWFLEPETVAMSIDYRGAKKGGVTCPLTTIKDSQGKPMAGPNGGYKFDLHPSFFSIRGVGDNNSQDDTGHCDFEFKFYEFRLVSKPIGT